MLEDGTNTIVNKMIERVPHPCKYGCHVKKYLKEIVEHEARCPERTIKCPYLKCMDQVKVCDYNTHAMAAENTCNIYRDKLTRTIITPFLIKTGSGESLQSVLSSSWNWAMMAFEDRGKIFYLHRHYFSTEQTFAFYVTAAAADSAKYLAEMTLKNKNDVRKSLSIAQNVIPMDSAPTDSKAVLASTSVMFVHWRTMSGFLKWKNKTSDGIEVKKSSIETTFDILIN